MKSAIEDHPDQAIDAIKSEFKQLMDKKVWRAVDPRQGPSARPIPFSMKVSQKYDAMGNFIKCKARLVAGGHRQERDEFTDTSSPTVSTEAVLSVLSISAFRGNHITLVDITGAYLHARLLAPQRMKLSIALTNILIDMYPLMQEFVQSDSCLYVDVDGALYGLIESSKLWYERLVGVLCSKMGFRVTRTDTCVFIRHIGTSKEAIICLHVDDMLISSKLIETADGIINDLKSEFGSIEVQRGMELSYIGMALKIDMVLRTIYVTQTS
jgi:hypothetical protein